MNQCQAIETQRPENSALRPASWFASVQTWLDQISANPQLWNLLRRIVEVDFRGERAVIADELAPWSDVGQRRYLDFGCGTGALAPCFPANHYVGVDLSTIYLHFAQQNLNGRFIASDGAALALANESFDAALVLGVLHHIPDALARAAMRELHRVLRPGATALIMEDIPPPDIWNIAGHAMHWLDRGGYIRSDNDYRALFGDGFVIIRSYAICSGICDYGVYVLRRNA
jgi:SAM-dependent methyltransferase